MSLWRSDPGECPICGAAHHGCTGDDPLEVVQMPAKDAAAAREKALNDAVQATPPGQFTTGTYRRPKKSKSG
jgi:hypothetical protein